MLERSISEKGHNNYKSIGFRKFKLCLKEKSWIFPTPDGVAQKQIHRLQRSPTMLEGIVMNVSDPGRGRTKTNPLTSEKSNYA